MKIKSKTKEEGRINFPSIKRKDIIPDKLYNVGELRSIFEDYGHPATHSWLHSNISRGVFEQGLFKKIGWEIFERATENSYRKVKGKTLLFLLDHEKEIRALA